MADIITSVKDARFSLSSKETFYQIKADQKAIMSNSKTHEILSAYNAAYDAWYKAKPQPIEGAKGEARFPDQTEWRKTMPKRPWVLDCSARSMNIIYGMLKGHSYREIEKTYREHHGPDADSIKRTLDHYGISYVDFLDACGEIDYE
jgi:hypothetical protein